MKIGEALIKAGILTSEHLDMALTVQKKTKERLGDITIKMGFVPHDKMAPFLASYFSLPYIKIENIYKSIKPELINLVPEELAYRFTVIPIEVFEKTLTIAMFDPLDVIAEDTLRLKTGFRIKRAVASERGIIEAIDYCYHELPRLKEHINDFVFLENGTKEPDLERLRVEASDPPVVKYVHQLVVQAINSSASDIHIQSKQDDVELRLRIDGILYNFDPPPKTMLSAIITRIKILSNLNITERRLPQDGRFKLQAARDEVDIRVSCFPTIYGESIVMRLLNTSSPLSGLEQLELSEGDLKKLRDVIKKPYGLILVTGPTGSGKTTTLYTCLNEIKSSDKNMITIEDPVEYRLPFLQQSQVNPAIGFDFARGLRSILRQDPDVIMVGEIRDKETALIAIHASLTGHLVFSTLHTNDATSATIRLIDMGVEPFLITSSLIAVLAQRLVRRICPECREEYQINKQILSKLSLNKDLKLFKGKGCPSCLQSGYRRRVAIFELLFANESIRELILARASNDEIKRKAQANGMKTLRESCIEKLEAGITTVDELLRVTQEQSEEV